MTDNPQPDGGNTSGQQDGDGRRYRVGADGNVHRVGMTIEVDRFVGFTDHATDPTAGPRNPDKPAF